jgi:exopolyphosphatase / guanosine-5'-triphosphate,3'-diphosphate pyrophosphatase
MRLGVLDVGSNTVHLLVVDAHVGAQPWPAYSHKTELRLTEHLDDAGAVTPAGTGQLVTLIREALAIAEDRGVENLLAFATSAIREASNVHQVLGEVNDETGVDLQVLSGAEEAQLTFLAVRRWFGWSSGRLLVVDIGGGSLEIAVGMDEIPEALVSLPLGAGRLTRDWLLGDPPSVEQVRELRRYVRAEIARHIREFTTAGRVDRVVATSKTFRQLARIAGAAPSSDGPYVRRQWLPRLAGMTASERAQLDGVSQGRAPQLLAGAIVADAAVDLLGVEALDLCPWALREGIILRRLDGIGAGDR